MKISKATVIDVLALNPNLSDGEAEDIISFGNPDDTVAETIIKLNGAPRGECAA